MGGGPLTPKDRAIHAARKRIEYKYAKPYIDTAPQTDKELEEEIDRILEEELTVDEKENLEDDFELEKEMIRRYYDVLQLGEED